MQRILAAIDLSDISDAVVDRAAALAQALGAKVWLVHVAPPDPEFVGYEAGPQTVRDVKAEHLRAEHRDLQARAEALEARGIDTEALLVRGPAVEEIREHARRVNAGLIVLGSHGHGALYHLLVGSVTEALLRDAPCPLMIVPAPKN